MRRRPEPRPGAPAAARRPARAAALALAVALALGAAPPAWAREAPDRGRVERITVRSAALGGRTRNVSVWLPPGYARDAAHRYPVVYLLHGLGGNDRDFFVHGRLEAHLQRLLGEGAVGPVLAVAPDGANGYWTDHAPPPVGDGEAWGTFVARDVVDAVDRRYRTVPEASHRALVGVSMGGWGAASLALLHPDRFGAAVSLGGALFPEAPTHRRVYARVWGNPPDARRFRATSPLALVEAWPAERPLPRLWLHCGDDDELGFLGHALRLHAALAARGAPHELRVTDGRHAWAAWEPQADGWLRFLDAGWGGRP